MSAPAPAKISYDLSLVGDSDVPLMWGGAFGAMSIVAPRQEGAHRGWHFTEFASQGAVGREESGRYFATPLRPTKQLRVHPFTGAGLLGVARQDEFHARTKEDLFAELQQRTELMVLRQEVAELRTTNQRLRTQARLHTPVIAAVAEEPATERQEELYGIVLPRSLEHFAASIERSRAMVELEDDWDGEGSLGYSEATWHRAVSFAVESARGFVSDGWVPPPAPAISKGPDGSVDVLWRQGTKKFMLNVPSEPGEPVTYHGFDAENDRRETQGVVDLGDRNEWIVAWLTR